jgi:hypothetical protein
MKTYKVSVERTMYVTGSVGALAKDPAEAEAKVQWMIDSGNLTVEDIEWDDADSLRTTGDVDEL